jgi:hypothetical protein
MLTTFISESLWFLVIVGWILLMATGLEADKPLSGGIPGHVSSADERHGSAEGLWGRLGAIGSWLVFGLVALSLPFVLWWIFVVHP